MITSQPGTGYTHGGFGGDVTPTGDPTTSVNMGAPRSVTLSFKPITNHTVTVTTLPTGLSFAVDGATSTTPVAVQWPALSKHKLETTTPQLLAGTYFGFLRWTIASGPVSPLAVYPDAAVTRPENYTAVFGATCHMLTVTVTPASSGTVTVNPAAGNVSGAPANCYAPGTQVTLTAAGSGTNTLTGWSGDATGTGASVAVIMNAPKTVTATFGAAASVNLTLETVPAGLSARIGAATINNPLSPTPVTSSVPANSSQSIVVLASVTRNGTWYAFQSWSNGTTTPLSQAQVGTTNLTVTATYATACHELTLSANPSAGGTVTASPASGNVTGFPANCYAPGTTVTFTANPAAGQTLQGWTGATPGAGNTATVVMSQPRTVTANFGAPANVTLTVATNPAGLDARIGASGAFTAASVSASVAANTSVPVAVTDPITKNGTGYRFANWVGAAPANSAGAASVAVGTSNQTATANFTVACYLLTVTPSPNNGGTLAATPLPNVAPFAGNCIVPGTVVTLTATPAAGRTFTNWSGDATGTNPSVQVTMSGPKTVTANFGLAPVVSVVAVNRSAGNVGVNILNAGGPANNLRITAIASTTSGITWDSTSRTLPISVGVLPNGGNYGINMFFKATTGSITSGFSFTVTVVADNLPSTTFTATAP